MSDQKQVPLTAEAIAKATATYGFTFVRANVEKDGKVFKSRPVVHITDPVAFRAAFPTFADERLESAVRIASQAHARNTSPDAEVMAANIAMLLGERVNRPALRYVAADGTKHATQEAATAASLAHVMKQVKSA